jgi:DNA-binding IclR family transcriptional regulator
LTGSERHVLLTLAAIDASGESLDYIIQLAGLEERRVLDSMETLVVRNLVEQRRQGKTVRYTIHNLTRTFLYKRIVDWDQDAVGSAGNAGSV